MYIFCLFVFMWHLGASDFQIIQKVVEIDDRSSSDNDVRSEFFVEEVNGASLFVGDAADDEDDDATLNDADVVG